MKFEVPQRQQLASERTSLTLLAPAPSTISFVPLTQNLSLADPSPTRGGQASQRQLPPASKYPSIAQRAPCSNRQTGQRVSVREIRYRKQPPTVRNTHSVLKKASCGTRRVFRSIRCKKQAFPVRKKYSVPKNSLLWYATHLQRCAKRHPATLNASSKARRTADSTDCGQPPAAADAFSEACRAKSSNCPPNASSVRETAPARRLADIKRG